MTKPETAEEKFQTESIVDFMKKAGAVLAFVTVVLSTFLGPMGLEQLNASYALLLTALIFALPSILTQTWSVLARIIAIVSLMASLILIGLWMRQVAQPRFEITVEQTLEESQNIYELTDMLIWNQHDLDEYGVNVTFTMQIRPIYSGKQHLGEVLASISGDGDTEIKKALWSDLTQNSPTKKIHLTLPELLAVSSLERNSEMPKNPFKSDEPPTQEAVIDIEIVQVARSESPLTTEQIKIRNAPWELRADLVWRNRRWEVDTYVRNYGDAGDFTTRYHLVKLKPEIESDTAPMNSGTETIAAWCDPETLVHLETGAILTQTVTLPENLGAGRYLLEVYPFKKQNYATFDDPQVTWENPNTLHTPWWFSGLDGPMRYDRFIFVITESRFENDPVIVAERNRLRDEEEVDLGLAIAPAKEIVSSRGTEGRYQVFQEGEIYVYGDGEESYVLYGPILEHYKDLGGYQDNELGFPISPVQVVTSSTGAKGYMMEFEGPPQGLARIYTSDKGTAAVCGWINTRYTEDEGAHTSWLGFPLTDRQYYTDSDIQQFEGGYIVYYYPNVGDERIWNRTPTIYPYLASRGTLIDVHAEQDWQDTGVSVASADQLTIVQIDGEWTYWSDYVKPFDANGDINEYLQEDVPLKSEPVGALIGKIGKDGDPFPVGRWRTFTTSNEGTLYLAMNDGEHSDNAGHVTVMIERK
jgi:hypothetical protein